MDTSEETQNSEIDEMTWIRRFRRGATPIRSDYNWRMSYTDTWHNNENDGIDEVMNGTSSEEDFEIIDAEDVEVTEKMSTISHTSTDLESTNRGLLRFTLTIENFTAFCSRQSKVTSDSFKCRNIPFSLIVQNYNKSDTTGRLSAYLKRDETNDRNIDNGLDICASCDLNIRDQITGEKLIKSFPSHLFHAGSDWGFAYFIDAATLGKNPGYIHNDSMIIDVLIKAEPPYCYSNHSKSITGFVGIKNQGATCYMNSLLQVLFFITKFRTACYRIPTEMDNHSSLALALQKVFYNLQFSDTAVCTKNLTRSFGWSNNDVLMQHDIQEMMRLLIEKIEARMKNSLLETVLPGMFQGKFISYVRCRDVEFSSQREEVFYDIQLSLDDTKNVYDSFKRYVSPEMMDDENKYHAGTFGLQAAEKGTLFISLPPVMFLHLLRFQFDAAINQVVKNNNFYEFYEHIDLTEFVREEETTPSKYTLFAVLSHSGGGSHGHYVAYVNPSLKGDWLKFDDDLISLVHRSDAIDSNFGSTSDVDEWTRSMQLNAYMLVYIRDSDIEDIFAPTDPMYITDELAQSVKHDKEQEYCNNLIYHYTTEVYVFLDTLLESEIPFAASKCDRPLKMPRFSITRACTANDFKANIIQPAFKISNINQIRIWPIFHYSSYDSQPIFIEEDALLVQFFSECKNRDHYLYPYTIWVEMAAPESELPAFDPEKDVLVFYYFYCARACRPYYIHHGYHDKNSKVEELVPVLNTLMNWSNRESNIYKISIPPHELSMSSYISEYANHGLNTFFMNVTFELKDHDETTLLNSYLLYYDDISSRVTVCFSKHDDSKVAEYFNVSLNTTFPELLDMLAARVKYDRNKIQIFVKRYVTRDTKGEPIPSTSTERLGNIIECAQQKQYMAYKLHHADVIDVETKIHFTFHWLTIDLRHSLKFTLYISEDDSIDSIITSAKDVIKPDQPNGSGKFRILCITDDRLKLVTDTKQILKQMEDSKRTCKKKSFRIEEIPQGDDIFNENEENIMVISTRIYNIRPPVYSFFFKINLTESWESIKNRLRDRLNKPETFWDDFQPVVLAHGNDEVDIDDTKCFNDLNHPISKLVICLSHKRMVKRDGAFM